MKNAFCRHWALVWLAQWLAMLLAGVACAGVPIAAPAFALAWRLCQYLAMPIAAALGAYLSVRGGLLALAAWIAPCAAGQLGHWLITGYAAGAGPFGAALLAAVVGAAAGEVKKNRNSR